MRIGRVLVQASGTAAFVLAGAADAQTPRVGLTLVITGRATHSSPEVRVTILGWFDRVSGTAELFSSAEFDLAAADGQWVSFDQCLNTGCVPGPALTERSFAGLLRANCISLRMFRATPLTPWLSPKECGERGTSIAGACQSAPPRVEYGPTAASTRNMNTRWPLHSLKDLV